MTTLEKLLLAAGVGVGGYYLYKKARFPRITLGNGGNNVAAVQQTVTGGIAPAMLPKIDLSTIDQDLAESLRNTAASTGASIEQLIADVAPTLAKPCYVGVYLSEYNRPYWQKYRNVQPPCRISRVPSAALCPDGYGNWDGSACYKLSTCPQGKNSFNGYVCR